jgi:hypothetical protein
MKNIFNMAATVLLAALIMFARSGTWAAEHAAFHPRPIHTDILPARNSFTGDPKVFTIPIQSKITIAETTGKSDVVENTAGNSRTNLPDSMRIVFSGNRLSVFLKDVYLEDVLKEITRKTNVEIIAKGALNEKVKLEFVNLTLEEGLQRILKNQNYSFTYFKTKDTANGRAQYVISRVFILGPSSSSQTDNKRSSTFSMETSAQKTSQPLIPTDISADIINQILNQDPQAQEDALKALSEAISNDLPAINQQLQEIIQQFEQPGENSLPPEILEKLLPESEMNKIQQSAPIQED